MLYIFDLGNVIVEIDFQRALGVWSNFSRVPLATLQQRFQMGALVEQHERGEITDETFAQGLCDELGIALGFEQFVAGWQAIFVKVYPQIITLMHQLRSEGHRVVVLSNTNRLHCSYWPSQYPEIQSAADKFYLSQEMGLRKPDLAIYQAVLNAEGVSAEQAVFFDDNKENIEAAEKIGIRSIHVTSSQSITHYFASLN